MKMKKLTFIDSRCQLPKTSQNMFLTLILSINRHAEILGAHLLLLDYVIHKYVILFFHLKCDDVYRDKTQI